MCNIGGGANRCDAHWGESQKAADLAKRRAKYATSRGGIVREYRHKTNISDREPIIQILAMEQAIEDTDYQNETGIMKVQGVSKRNKLAKNVLGLPKSSLLTVSSANEYNEKLGITISHLKGDLVDQGYYSNRTVEGTINWKNLDEQSYEVFGFTHPAEERGIFHTDVKTFLHRSEKELQYLTAENRNALTVFSSSDFSWINKSLYNKDEVEGQNVSSYDGQQVTLKNIDLNKEKNEKGVYNSGTEKNSEWVINPKSKTPEQLNEVVKQLDDAMSKSIGQQRIVYRGVLTEHSNLIGIAHKDAENYKLGQELVFDGYQSTSYSPVTALYYAGIDERGPKKDSLMFEISTSSGVNIANASHYQDEMEVVLPRGSRYMIVGIHSKVYYNARNSTADDKKAHPATPVNSHRMRCKKVTVVQIVEIADNGQVASEANRPSPAPDLTKAQLAYKKI